MTTAEPTYQELRQQIQKLEQKQADLLQTISKLRQYPIPAGNIRELPDIPGSDTSSDSFFLHTGIFREALDDVPAYVYIKDREYRYVYANRLTLDLYHCSEKDLIGSDDFRFFPPESVRRLREIDETVLAGRKTSEEVDIIDPNGLRKVYWEVKTPVFRHPGEDPVGLLGISADITSQKNTARQLEEAWHFVQSIIDSLSAHICVIDESGCIVFVNRAWTRFAESNPPILGSVGIGANYLHVCDSAEGPSSEGADLFAAGIRRVLQGEVAEFTMESPCHSPSKQRWFVGRVTRLSVGNTLRAVVAHENITENKLAEQLLRTSEERFRSLVEGAPDAIFIQADSRFQYVNPACLKLLGASSPEDLIGSQILDRFPPAFRGQVKQRIHRLNVEKKPVSLIEELLLRMNGTGIPVEITAVPTVYEGRDGAIVFVRDITERKQAEEKMANHYRLLRAAGRTARFGGWRVDLNDNRCIWSDTVTEIHEMPPGSSPTIEEGIRFYAPEFREKIRQVFWDCVQKGIPYDEELELISRSGKRVWVRTIGEPVRDHRGVIVEVRGSFQDITERKSYEIEQENLKQQVFQLRKMESVGRLAGGIAHDFNNKLQAILGYTEILIDTAPTDGFLTKALGEIQKAARGSAELVRQLLGFARKQMIQPRSLNLNHLIRDMYTILSKLIGENISLKWEPGQDIRPVFMDPDQVHQILINLCLNSRDAIQETGSITIRTENIHLDALYCLLLPEAIPGDYVRLSVTDDGHGMDPHTLEHIFEPFFSTKDFGAGAGLGLATVYGIVQQNKGFIHVFSQPGAGTTFTLYFQQDTAGAETVPDEPVFLPGSGQETILLVEDDPAILNMLEMMLQKFGYTLLTAPLPASALRMAMDQNRKIDLLLTDIVMPEKSGPQLAREMAAFYPDMKCLFMSGYSAETIAREGQLPIGENFIQKPFTFQDLIQKIQAVLTR